MSVLAYGLALFVGLVLGLVGGGGALLAMPVLVYVMGVAPLPATGASLLVVGLSSLIGALGYARRGLVDGLALLYFGLPSVLSVWLARAWLLPALPDSVAGVDKGRWLMMAFAGLMLLAAWRMAAPASLPRLERHPLRLGLQGLAVGAVTGTVGAGGGFLIVPALAMGAGLALNRAVATSLAIIAINSAVGLMASLKGTGLPDSQLLAGFAGAAVLGLLLGLKLAPRMPAAGLRKGFAAFTAVLGVLVLAREIGSLL
ncbi:MAG: sulfite exporter TauE/SafE family protein [Gammaproteobacteria bacterium]|nr:sulfite exporter TauE/SafE family protein [Gammaproteobacteria bacterium]